VYNKYIGTREAKQMKNLLVTTAILATMATSAVAETVSARITYVEPRYDTVTQYKNSTQCHNVEVPVYGTVHGGATGGDVLAGMIIGGILGKGVTGNDNGAAAGAVMGGVIAADNNRSRQVVTGYRMERQCNEVSVPTQVNQLRDYLIRFEWNGMTGSAYTYNQYRVGDRISATVSIRAN
jgi:hypothetical protein